VGGGKWWDGQVSAKKYHKICVFWILTVRVSEQFVMLLAAKRKGKCTCG
jgi:hypothetical protein